MTSAAKTAEKLVLQNPKVTRRGFLGIGITLTAGALLLKPDTIFGQTGLTLEQVKSWFSKTADYKSAPFGAKTIKLIQGSSTIDIGGSKVDITKELAKIGLQTIGPDAKIVYGGKDAPFETYFFTDAKANGMLKLFVSSGGAIATSDRMAHEQIKITPGFSLFAATNGIAAALCETKLIVFDFGERRIKPLSIENFVAEKDLTGLKVAVKNESGTIYLAIDGEKLQKIYIVNYTEYAKTGRTSVQSIPKK